MLNVLCSSAPHPSPSNAVPPRRKPGRPKGSKNKKPRFDLSGSPPKIPPFPATPPFYGYAQPPPGSVPMQAHPPVHPVTVPPPNPFPADSNNSQFYDFQWRVLTLCSEFYNAADELIVRYLHISAHVCFVSTSPLIAECSSSHRFPVLQSPFGTYRSNQYSA